MSYIKRKCVFWGLQPGKTQTGPLSDVHVRPLNVAKSSALVSEVPLGPYIM